MPGAFSVDVSQECRLLWLCRQLLEAPLPPTWEKVRRRPVETALSPTDVTVFFKNTVTDKEVPMHPGSEFLLQEVRRGGVSLLLI